MAYTTIKFRRDTSANWTNVNPVLDDGEIGFETDTLKYKVGNGRNIWADLPYPPGGGGGSSVAWADVVGDISTNAALVAALNNKQGISTKDLPGGYVGIGVEGFMDASFIPEGIERKANKDTANGYPGLDEDGRLLVLQLPSAVELNTNKGLAGGYAPLDGEKFVPDANLSALVQRTTLKGVANGYAGLDVNAEVPALQLPIATEEEAQEGTAEDRIVNALQLKTYGRDLMKKAIDQWVFLNWGGQYWGNTNFQLFGIIHAEEIGQWIIYGYSSISSEYNQCVRTSDYPISINSWTSRSVGDGAAVARTARVGCWSPERKQYVIAGIKPSGNVNWISTSPDGINWTDRAPALPTGIQYRSCDWCSGFGLYILSAAGTAGNNIQTSPDGVLWTVRSTPTVPSAGIAIIDSAYSPELNMWIGVSFDAADGNNFLVVSYDGLQYSRITIPFTGRGKSIAWSPLLKRFVLLVAGTNTVTQGCIWTSANGTDWVVADIKPSLPIPSATAAVSWIPDINIYIAAPLFLPGSTTIGGTGLLGLSYDGIDWLLSTYNAAQYTTGPYNVKLLWDKEHALVMGTQNLANSSSGGSSIPTPAYPYPPSLLP